jgi:hypothetical protein
MSVATLARNADGQTAIPLRVIRSQEAFTQRLRHRFRFFLGEWFLDLRLGVPYYDYLFVANPDDRIVRALIRRIIEGVPGAKNIASMVIAIDRKTRRCTVSELEIEMTDGETYYSQSDTFVIALPLG